MSIKNSNDRDPTAWIFRQRGRNFFSSLRSTRDRLQLYVSEDGVRPGSDMYIVNASNIKAIATLSDLNPGDAMPVLLIGKTDIDLPIR
jgi:hypothetical protein